MIAGDLIADLRARADALRLRDATHASAGASAAVLADLQTKIRSARGGEIAVPTYRFDRISLKLRPGVGQGPPTILALAAGVVQQSVYTGSPPTLQRQDGQVPFTGTFELGQGDPRYVILAAPGVSPAVVRPVAPTAVVVAKPGGLRLRNVAAQVGLSFRQDAFRFGMSSDVPAMMGGGLCWLDYNNDGWLDLFVVNSYSDSDIGKWNARGGLPRSVLYENVKGKFVDVSRRSHAGLAVKGEGCVAGDLNGDGRTDLYITTASDDKLLWNNGDGTFTEGARSSGVVSFGWHSGAAIGDVNGDGRPDLFVAGYTEANAPIPGSMSGYPTNHLGVRDLLFLNEGNGPNGHARFREVGRRAGIDPAPYDHSLGAVFSDLNGDGRLDLYVANDDDPNRYYVNVPARNGLGFRFVDRAPVRASPTRTRAWGSPRGTSTATGGPTWSSATRVGNSTRSSVAAARRSRTGRPRSRPPSGRTSPAGVSHGPT